MGKLNLGASATIGTVLLAMILFAAPKAAVAAYAGSREIMCTDYGSSSITIDDVSWIFPPYSECTETYIGGGGGGNTYYDPGPTGGGGGGGGLGLTDAPDLDRNHNPNRATCKSSSLDRYLHIIADFGAWKAEHAPNRFNGKGELIQFTYDDGGVELYSWIPGAIAASTEDPETYLARIPNTLRCPS